MENEAVPGRQSLAPDMAFVKRIMVPKMAQVVATNIRREIVRGNLNEGDSLPTEADLMESFGVSRPTLREAFRILETESLISIRRGSRGGARIQMPSPEVAGRYTGTLLQMMGTTLADVHLARMVIEPASARILSENLTEQALEGLRSTVEQEKSGQTTPHVIIATSVAFHQQVVQFTGNNTLTVLWGMLAHIIEAHHAEVVAKEISQSGPKVKNLKGYRAHVHLLELLEAGDSGEVERFWRKHVEEADAWMMRHLGPRDLLEVL